MKKENKLLEILNNIITCEWEFNKKNIYTIDYWINTGKWLEVTESFVKQLRLYKRMIRNDINFWDKFHRKYNCKISWVEGKYVLITSLEEDQSYYMTDKYNIEEFISEK